MSLSGGHVIQLTTGALFATIAFESHYGLYFLCAHIQSHSMIFDDSLNSTNFSSKQTADSTVSLVLLSAHRLLRDNHFKLFNQVQKSILIRVETTN